MASRASIAAGAWEPALGPARDDGRLVAESGEPATMAKLTGLPGELEPALREALLGAGIWIIEGLNLAQVEAGSYELLCLPLKIADGDGAPARALLRKAE